MPSKASKTVNHCYYDDTTELNYIYRRFLDPFLDSHQSNRKIRKKLSFIYIYIYIYDLEGIESKIKSFYSIICQLNCIKYIYKN